MWRLSVKTTDNTGSSGSSGSGESGWVYLLPVFYEFNEERCMIDTPNIYLALDLCVCSGLEKWEIMTVKNCIT
jgi:hypothetical protein